MSVATGARQAAFCDTMVDELIRAGVRDAVICPGSRSTPLTLAVARSSLRVHVRLDERSAGFFALGLAKRSGRPSLIVVTSGTAAAELHAAVAEASLDDVPFIVVTADRPPELHDIGAPQTIPQSEMFAPLTRFSMSPGTASALPRASWRAIASRLAAEATGLVGSPGPVHANLGFVDPLVGRAEELPPGRPSAEPWFRAPVVYHELSSVVFTQLEARRGVIVAGRGCGAAATLLAGAVALGWPVIADPRSGLRSEGTGVITTADSLLRSPHVVDRLDPEVIVLVGAPPASKVVGEWISTCASEGARVIVIGEHGPARHPTRTAADFVVTEPTSFFAGLASADLTACVDWRELWSALEVRADEVIGSLLDAEALSEPSVARTVARAVGQAATIVASSSMPLRDLEWFGGTISTAGAVLANRGANGIDGVVSMALGAATGGEGPVVALVGDLAFFHDVSALVDGLAPGSSAVIVVVDNDGGGIFSFLPQHELLDPEVFETLFGTPRRTEVAHVARGFGVDCVEVQTTDELRGALVDAMAVDGVTVLVARVRDRDANVELHNRLNATVAAAVAELLS